MAVIRRADGRDVTTQPGITTRHCFSAGAHYDPDNVSFGPMIGCDDHEVGPGAGFDWHAHRGVLIVSWVLDGTLRHEDDSGGQLLARAGEVLVQATGDGIRHRETNASDTAPLHFVQSTLLLDLPRSTGLVDLPERFGPVGVDVVHGASTVGPGHLFVGAGGVVLDGAALGPGDSARLDRAASLGGAGGALVLTFDA